MVNTLKSLDIGRELLADAEFSEPSYILMPLANNYAQGVHALQETCQAEGNQNHPRYVKPDGSRIYRPLTFRENLQARVEDYETLTDEKGDKRSLDGRLRFFYTWLNSCGGIAYKNGTTKFKLVPICEELITIDEDISDNDFNGASLPIDYDSLQGVELDLEKVKYEESLTMDKILNNPALLTVVEDDKALLKAYADIIFNEFGGNKAMGFLPLPPWRKNCLRPLYVEKGYELAGCVSGLLIYAGSFLRVAP